MLISGVRIWDRTLGDIIESKRDVNRMAIIFLTQAFAPI